MMQFLRAFGIVASLAVLATGANAQSSKPRELQGAKAIKAITGSTIIFNGPSGRVVAFIAADHTGESLKEGKREKFEWSSNKTNQLCITHEYPCLTIKVLGSEGVIIDNKDIVTPFDIEPGNQVDAHSAKG